MDRRAAVLALAACGGSPRFERTHELTADDVATLGAIRGDRRLSADERAADAMFLDDLLAGEWIGMAPDLRTRLRAAATHAHAAHELCVLLGDIDFERTLTFSLDGKRCNRDSRTIPPPTAAPPRTGPLFESRIDGTGPAAVGVIALHELAPPDDPRWAGFGDALRALAGHDLLLIDLRGARGDDPRAGLALLHLFGLDLVRHSAMPTLRAPVLHDDPIAQAARANRKRLRGDVPVRSRELWATLADDEQRIALGAEMLARFAPELANQPAVVLGKLHVLYDHDTGVAGELLGHLAGEHDSQALAGQTSSDGLIGDEWGLARLPHSGIDVEWPTARYGGHGTTPLMGAFVVAPELPAQMLADLRANGERRAVIAKNAAQPLPSCAEILVAPVELGAKQGGCNNKQDAGWVFIALPIATAQQFVAGCPGLKATGVEVNSHTGSLMTVTGPHDQIARLAAATFVDRIEWSCPPHLD